MNRCTCGAETRDILAHASDCALRAYTMDDVDEALITILGTSYDPNDRVRSMDRAARLCFIDNRHDRHAQVLRASLAHLTRRGVILPEDCKTRHTEKETA